VQSILPVELPRVPEKRFLIVMEKTSPTPEKYPRRPGVAAKRPLA
jgi:16S rRNA (guanine527-N7)-methyltransferase